MICEYGCGQEATFLSKNGKSCCSSHFSKCPSRRKKFSGKNNPMFGNEAWNKGKSGIYSKKTIEKMSVSKPTKGKTYEEIYGIEKANELKQIRAKHFSEFRTGKDPWNKNKKNIYSKETLKKISISRTYGIEDYIKKYPEFVELESPEFNNNKMFIKCKHCNKLFTPTRIQLTERLRSIGNGIKKSYFYCSNECKKNNEFYNRKVDPETLIEFRKYSSLVWIYTNETLKNHQIKNINLRGRNKLHLDHKFSILEGFKQNIEPKLLSHYKNLIMLPERENIQKGSDCSITLEELKSY